MANVNRQETMARRVRVYTAITAGKTFREIMATEGLSDDALTDHLKAINKQLGTWAADQQNRALALAIGTYTRVIDEAWIAWAEAKQKLDAWLAGDYDREEEHPAMDGGTITVRKPPVLRLQMQEYLATIINATKELTKLAGLDKVDVTLHGDLLLRRYEGVNVDEV